MENHIMQGNKAGASYIRLLLFVQRLMKPYAKEYDEENCFAKRVYQAIGETEPFEELLTDAMRCEEASVSQWAEEVRETSGNAAFALETLLLWQEMEVGEAGLEALSGIFDLMGFDSDMVSEAAQAAKMIDEDDLESFASADWHTLTPETLKGCILDESETEQELLESAESLFVGDRVKEAYPHFENLAKLGNGRALYFVGEYHNHGWGNLKKNTECAFSYYREGAKRGDSLCSAMLADEPDADKEKILAETAAKVIALAKTDDIVAKVHWNEILEGNIVFFAGKGAAILTESGFANLRKARQFAKACMTQAAEAGYWLAILRLTEVDAKGNLKGENEEKTGNWLQNLFQSKKNPSEQAVEWLQKVYEAKGDHMMEAFERIVDLYEKEGENKKAERWYEKSVEDGYDWGLKIRANKYFMADCLDEALKWYQKIYGMYGINSGYAAAMIGVIYQEKSESEKGFKWFQKSAEEGCDLGMCGIGDCYRFGVGVEKNTDKAMEWYRTVYEKQGDAAGDAANEIGLLYRNDLQEPETALEWYKKSADLGCDWGMKNLGGMYANGKGVEKNTDKAMEWYRKAYEKQGDAAEDAANNIGVIYENDLQEYETAVEWYKKSADLGSDFGMRNLGYMYANGKGIEKNIDKAMEWYRKAYEKQGDVAGLAANGIGVIYEHDLQEPKTAVKWYQKSADLGCDWGMKNLGGMYRYGRGVEKNIDKAMEWYRKVYEKHGACETVAADAIRELGGKV